MDVMEIRMSDEAAIVESQVAGAGGVVGYWLATWMQFEREVDWLTRMGSPDREYLDECWARLSSAAWMFEQLGGWPAVRESL